MIFSCIKGKKLNNKGFTLIELLAVVVILAVVMGIAMTSVLSSMNKSRGGSLEDTAMVIAQGFTQKYTESLVGGIPNNIYKDEGAEGYSFQSDATYALTTNLEETFNISSGTYALGDSTTLANSTSAATTSFVHFTASNGKFIVCMVANKNGNFFVDNFKLDAATKIESTGVTIASGEMFACSDGTRSW